jgi:hypothetical protein
MSKLLQIPESWGETKRVLENKLNSFNKWGDNLSHKTTRYAKEREFGDNVVRILSFPEISPSGKQDMIKEFDYTHNVITDAGEIYYAKLSAGEAAATNEDFGGTGAGTGYFEIGTTAFTTLETSTFGDWDVGAASKITGSRLTFTGGYPKTNDTGDTDNSGDTEQTVSYAINYSAASWNDTDVETGVIHDNASPVSGTLLLSGWSFTPFAKTASDTLKIFVNHLFENQ